ncbi:MAG: hypothetical protein E6343_01920 [Clostridium perfringens]|nr:hypothetical protein [Clostridium perfringens]HBC2031384.1 hypothetical protein [Clostridium perfringens]HBC2034786.1 hypothetical protein [Clostridium perfringens]HBC2057934.1 hypothetical protein [Clostridium perfringens]HBC2072091.1 hypothetical protein [Clostridium perfringens]
MRKIYSESAECLISNLGNDLENGESNLVPIMQCYFKAYLESNCFDFFLTADALLQEIMDIRNTNKELENLTEKE